MNGKKKTNSNTNSRQSRNSENLGVREQLSQFYSAAKEKLLAMKSDVEKSKKEYEMQKELNRKKELEYSELLKESKELDIKLKGAYEKVLIAKRNENFLQSQINLTKFEIDNANSEIDFLKLETNNKVKKVETESKQIHLAKENQLKSIQERIDKETVINNELIQKIKEVEARIKELSVSISNANDEENRKNNILLNEAAKMTKFLAEL